jgi:hypothetical protein
MAINYTAAGAVVANATSAAVAYPSGIQSGDLLLLTAVSKYTAYTSAPPTGFTLLREQIGGSGGSGADVGDVRLAVWYRIATGSETGSVSVTKAVQGGSVILARMFLFRRTAGAGWDFQHTSGVDSTGNTSWSVAGAANIHLDAGDRVVMVTGANSDAPSFSAHALSATGATFGTITERQDSGTTTGDDVLLVMAEGSVSTGPSTAAPTYTATASTGTPEGASILIRLREARLLTAEVGTYALTGQVANLIAPAPDPRAWSENAWYSGAWYGTVWYQNVPEELDAAHGTYALTGQAAGLRASRQIVASAGTYSLTGQDAAPKYGRIMTAGVGTHTLTGVAATLEYFSSSNSAWAPDAWAEGSWAGTAWYTGSRSFALDYAPYTLTGQSVGLRKTSRMEAGAGQYIQSGQDAGLEKAQRKIVAETGAITLTGGEANFYRSNVAGKAWAEDAWYDGAWYGTVWADDYGGLNNYSMLAGHGEYDVIGIEANLNFGFTLSAETGYYTQTGDDALRDILMRAEYGTYALTGQPALGGRGRPMLGGAGGYAVIGQNANLLRGYRMSAQFGAHLVIGYDVTFASGLGQTADTGTYTQTGVAAALKAGRKLTAEVGAYVLTGQDVRIGSAQVFLVETGTYVLTGQAVSFSRGYTLQAECGRYTVGGQLVSPVTTVKKPGKSKTKKVVRIDDQEFIVDTDEEAIALLEQAAEIAAETARAQIARVQESSKRGRKKAVASAREALQTVIEAEGFDAQSYIAKITQTYAEALKEIETKKKAEDKRTQDEEDAIILNLLNL